MSALSPVLRLSAIGFLSLALAMGIGRFAYTPLLPMMRDDGLLSLSDGGLIASIHFLGYWMGALVAARLPLSPRAALRLALLAIGAATLGMGLSADLAVLAVLRWIAGLCSAWVLVLISNFVVRRLAEIGRPAGQGIVFSGVVFSGVGGGIALAGLACLAFMAGGVDSGTAWQIVGLASLIVAAALCLSLGAELPTVRATRRARSEGRVPLVWPMIASYGMAGMGYVVPATYLPVMAREIVSDPLVFGWSWPIFGAAACASTLLAARLRRRWSERAIWAASQVVMALGVVLPVLVPHIAGIALSGLLVGGTFMIVTMAGLQEAHRVAPTDAIRHIAAMTTAFATGQMIGPLLASSIHAVTGSFHAVLVGTAVALAATALPLLRLPSPGRLSPS